MWGRLWQALLPSHGSVSQSFSRQQTRAGPRGGGPRPPESEARILMKGRRLAEQLLGAACLQLCSMAPSWQVQGDLGAQGERLWHDWPLMSLARSSKEQYPAAPLNSGCPSTSSIALELCPRQGINKAAGAGSTQPTLYHSRSQLTVNIHVLYIIPCCMSGRTMGQMLQYLFTS